MSITLQGAKTWLFWTGLLLAGMLVVVMLGSGVGSSQALTPLDGVQVSKAVNMPSVAPGQSPAPLYTVAFSNPYTAAVVLDAITDTLPSGFVFLGMDPSSGWTTGPDDTEAPDIVWLGPITIAASSTLSLVYAVDVPVTVPPTTTPYVNTVTAVLTDGTPIGPATAQIRVGEADLSVNKAVWPTRAAPGGLVTYTVVFTNSGHLTGTLTTISDTLDPALTFVQMVAGSDVMTPPQEVSGALVWTDTLVVRPLATLTLRYQAQAPAEAFQSPLCNEVKAWTAEGTLGPAQTCVQPDRFYVYLPIMFRDFEYARLTISKSASSTAFVSNSGAKATYTVLITNVGDTTGSLLSVYDTLPPGFTFSGMAAGSDITADPTGATGTITWEGSWAMPPGHQLRLAYQATVNDAVGQYTNSVNVTAYAATLPREPVSVTVFVDEPIAGLSAANDGPTMEGDPTTLSVGVTAGSNVSYDWDFGDGTAGSGDVVAHTYPAVGVYTATVTATNSVSQDTATTVVTIEPGVLLQDDFENGIGRWTKFTNYWRNTEEQWFWGANDGVGGSGAATHDCTLGKPEPERGAHDGLLMYLEPGSESWTDYRVETKLFLRGGMSDDGLFEADGGYPVGLWVRGQYQDVGDADPAGWVTGYYIVVGGKPGKQGYVRLAQLQTETDCWGNACNNPHNLYDFNNPHELVTIKPAGFVFERYQWYTLVVEVRGDRILAWINGIPAIDYVDAKEPFLTGTVGFKTYKSWTISFDDVIVTPLND